MSVRRLLTCQVSDSNLLDSGHQLALRLPAVSVSDGSPSNEGEGSASLEGDDNYSRFLLHLHSRLQQASSGGPPGGPIPASALVFPEAKSLKELLVQFIAKTMRYFILADVTAPTPRARTKSPLGSLVDHLSHNILDAVIKNKELSSDVVSILAPSLRILDLTEARIAGMLAGNPFAANEPIQSHWWNSMLRSIVQNTNLISLSFSNNPQISNRHIQILCDSGALPKLQNLDLQSCKKLTGEALLAITQLKSLVSLNMSSTKLTTEDVPLFEELPLLRHLNIERCKLIGKKGTMHLYSLGKFSTFHYRLCNNVVALALLGTHQAGKSTLFKHFHLLLNHSTAFSREELESYKEVIISNCIQEMTRLVALVKASSGTNLQFEYPQETHDAMNRIETMKEPMSTAQDGDAIHQISLIWREPVVRLIFEENKSSFLDSIECFFNSLRRIGQPDYIPTIDDMLRSRVKTIGIVEETLEVGGLTFRIFDTGSERNERKKWAYTFDPSLTMIIYVASLSEYDQLCYEDDTTSRMRESICVFREIQESITLRRADLCLVLNKEDVLREKLHRVSLSNYFDEFNGGNDFGAACKFIKRLYLSSEQYENEQAVFRMHESLRRSEQDSTAADATGTQSTTSDPEDVGGEEEENAMLTTRRIGSFPLISLAQRQQNQRHFDAPSDSDDDDKLEPQTYDDIQQTRHSNLYSEQAAEFQRSTLHWFQKFLAENPAIREKLAFSRQPPAAQIAQARLQTRVGGPLGRPMSDPLNIGTNSSASSSGSPPHRNHLVSRLSSSQGARHRSFDAGSLPSGQHSRANSSQSSSPNSARTAHESHRSRSFSGNIVNDLRITPRNTTAFVASALDKVHVRQILETMHNNIAMRVLTRDLD